MPIHKRLQHELRGRVHELRRIGHGGRRLLLNYAEAGP
jgi:hypothetical protein